MRYRLLRHLQREHDRWLALLFLLARPAVEAALAEFLATYPEVRSVGWTLARPAAANFAHVVTGVTFQLRDGRVLDADAGTPRPRRYARLADLLHANGEVLAAACGQDVRVVADRDGLAITPRAS